MKKIIKAFVFVLFVIFLQFLVSYLIKRFIPSFETKFAVLLGVDLSIIIAYVLSNFYFFEKVSTKLIQTSFKKIFLFYFGILFWCYISPVFTFPLFSYLPELNVDFGILKSKSLYSLFRVLLLYPIIEELLFRKIILKSLIVKNSKFISVIVLSFLFSLYHLDFYSFLNYFIGSVIFSYIYINTNSIVVVIIGHLLFNFFNLILC